MYRAIIVDDDPMVRFINKSFVEQHSAFHVVGEFSTGKETLSFLSKQPAGPPEGYSGEMYRHRRRPDNGCKRYENVQ
jgi:hypothetical protein